MMPSAMPIMPLNSTMKLESCGPQANNAPGMASATPAGSSRRSTAPPAIRSLPGSAPDRVSSDTSRLPAENARRPSPIRIATLLLSSGCAMSGIASADVAPPHAGPRHDLRPPRVRLKRDDRSNDGAHQDHHDKRERAALELIRVHPLEVDVRDLHEDEIAHDDRRRRIQRVAFGRWRWSIIGCIIDRFKIDTMRRIRQPAAAPARDR